MSQERKMAMKTKRKLTSKPRMVFVPDNGPARKTKRKKKGKRVPRPPAPVMSMTELARLGGGKVAYIKVMTYKEAKELFPAVEDLPKGIDLYALHAADGTPLVLTDSHHAAVGHAMGDELIIENLH